MAGFGAIGRTIIEHWPDALADLADLAVVCVRERQRAEAEACLGPRGTVVTSVDRMLALGPDLVIEAAGHELVRADGARILAAGSDLYVLSVGALADDALQRELLAAARSGASRLCIPAGALAGFDGLLSYRQQGLRSVRYTSTKPPLAWAGTIAEQRCALDALAEPTILFSGSAREAARLYPKNANLAAAVALAGIGLDATEVVLVADPAVRTNGGVIEAVGASGTLRVEVRGEANHRNPKTSAVVGMSVLASLRNHLSGIAFV